MTGENLFATPSATKHKVTLKFDVQQGGQPFMDQVTNYHNCSDNHVAAITGMAVDQAAFLGTKGKKPKGQQFDIDMTLAVDGTEKAKGSWEGLSREAAMGFERHVLNIWLHGNDQTAVANKALGKI